MNTPLRTAFVAILIFGSLLIIGVYLGRTEHPLIFRWVSLLTIGIILFLCLIIWLLEKARNAELTNAPEEQPITKAAYAEPASQTITSLELKEEWRRLESAFNNGGFPSELYAYWVQNHLHGGVLEWDVSAGTDLQRKSFRIISEEAGSLLSTSAYMKRNFPDLLAEPSPVNLWMRSVCAILDEHLKASGEAYEYGSRTVSGVVKEIAKKSALACAYLAAKESISRAAPDSATFSDSDPRVYVEVQELEGEPIYLNSTQTPFLLTNRGGSVAHKVQISIPLSVGDVSFPVVDALHPSEPREVLPCAQGVVGRIGADRFAQNDLSNLLAEQPKQNEPLDSEKTFPLTVSYEDYSGRHRFETHAMLRYLYFQDAANRVRKNLGHRDRQRVLSIEDTEFRRLC